MSARNRRIPAWTTVPESAVVVSVPPVGLRPRLAALYLGVSATFLRGLPIDPVRVRGNGSHGKPVVLYLRRDLDAWLDREAARRDPAIREHSEQGA